MKIQNSQSYKRKETCNTQRNPSWPDCRLLGGNLIGWGGGRVRLTVLKKKLSLRNTAPSKVTLHIWERETGAKRLCQHQTCLKRYTKESSSKSKKETLTSKKKVSKGRKLIDKRSIQINLDSFNVINKVYKPFPCLVWRPKSKNLKKNQ